MLEPKGKYCVKHEEIQEIHCPKCGSSDFLDWIDDVDTIECKCDENPHLYVSKFSCECGHEFVEIRDDRY